jgi:hypothetical protein
MGGKFARMMMRHILFAALLAAPPASAQSTSEGEEITVIGMGANGFRLTPEQLRGAVSGFEQHRATYAPAAQLIWYIQPAPQPGEIALELKSDSGSIPIPVAADGSFTLPHDKILTGTWRLVTSAAKGKIKIEPIAKSPASTREAFRMGDARLTCRAMWGFFAPNMSIVMRGIFSVAGLCTSTRIGVYFSSQKPLRTVTIDHWSKPIDIIKDRKAWRIPLAEAAISNEDLVHITYAP